jgi:steroid delta-isomerase-like uncharacterized protein
MERTSAASGQANVAIFRRAIDEAWNRGNLEVIDALFAPDFVEHQNGIGPGRDGVKGSIRALRAAFPDLHLEVADAIAQDDRAWIRLRGTGTHGGAFMGVPATGRAIEVDVIDIIRIADGRIVEHWGVADRLGVVQQLGLARGD